MCLITTGVCISDAFWRFRKPLNQWQHSSARTVALPLPNQCGIVADHSSIWVSVICKHFGGFLVPVEFTQIFQGYLLKRAIIRLPQFRRSTRVYMDRWNTWNHEKLAMWQMPTKMEARLEPCAYRADSRFVPSQWETALVYNEDSHKLVASLKSALSIYHETECVGCECNKMPNFLKPFNL